MLLKPIEQLQKNIKKKDFGSSQCTHAAQTHPIVMTTRKNTEYSFIDCVFFLQAILNSLKSLKVSNFMYYLNQGNRA